MRQHEAARALAAGEPLVSFFPSPPVALSLSCRREKKRKAAWLLLSGRPVLCAAGWLRHPLARHQREKATPGCCVRETLKMQALIGYYPWLVGLFTRSILIFLGRALPAESANGPYVYCSLAKGKLLCAPRRAT